MDRKPPTSERDIDTNESTGLQDDLPDEDTLPAIQSPMRFETDLSLNLSPSGSMSVQSLEDFSNQLSHSFDVQEAGENIGSESIELVGPHNQEYQPNIGADSTAHIDLRDEQDPTGSTQWVARMPRTPRGSDSSSDDDSEVLSSKRRSTDIQAQKSKRYKSEDSTIKSAQELQNLGKTIEENRTSFPLSPTTKKKLAFIAPKDQSVALQPTTETSKYPDVPQQKKTGARGKYKCGKCGNPNKANRICPFERTIRQTEDKETQTEEDKSSADGDKIIAVSKIWETVFDGHRKPTKAQPTDAANAAAESDEAEQPTSAQIDDAIVEGDNMPPNETAQVDQASADDGAGEQALNADNPEGDESNISAQSGQADPNEGSTTQQDTGNEEINRDSSDSDDEIGEIVAV